MPLCFVLFFWGFFYITEKRNSAQHIKAQGRWLKGLFCLFLLRSLSESLHWQDSTHRKHRVHDVFSTDLASRHHWAHYMTDLKLPQRHEKRIWNRYTCSCCDPSPSLLLRYLPHSWRKTGRPNPLLHWLLGATAKPLPIQKQSSPPSSFPLPCNNPQPHVPAVHE